MGSAGFSQYQGGTDLDEAFEAARLEAESEDGGRRGNVAAKDQVVALRRVPVVLEQAYRLAESFQDRNAKGVNDKYGPAGAIAVKGGKRYIETDIAPRKGGYASLDEAAEETVKAQGLLYPGEEVVYGVVGYASHTRGRYNEGRVKVPVQSGTGSEQTGWLFFGVAAD